MIRSEVQIRVRYAETDRMKVAHHSRYFEWFECARTELLRHIGYSYRQLEEEGCFLPVIEAYCKYRRAIQYDDLLRLEASITEVPGARMKITYRVYLEPGRQLVAEGFTVHAFMNEAGRAMRPPEGFLRHLRKALENDRVK